MDLNEQYWSHADSVEEFSQKKPEDFFKSEVHFLNLIKGGVRRVLDVGCASGRLIELMKMLCQRVSYTGIDITEDSIEQGCVLYPHARFILGNALNVELNETFDLVYSIGVFQHVPYYERLLNRMVEWSARYILFDVKAAAVSEPIVDLDRSYCKHEGDKNYFVILNWPQFRRQVLSLPDVTRISAWGYETSINQATRVPQDVLPIYSITLLLETGDSRNHTEVDEDVPLVLCEP